MNQAVNNTKSGVLFIISAPSGAGKTSLVQALAESMPDEIVISVSYTTRSKREGEQEGVSYHFVENQTFEQMVADNMFLEHAIVFDHQYGTSRTWVEQQLKEGKNVILEIDWQGAEQILKQFPRSVSIFILPPSYQALEERLTNRGNDDRGTIARRMQGALDEIAHFDSYEFIVINDDFDEALSNLKDIIRSSRHMAQHHGDFYNGFVEQLMRESKTI